MIDATPLPGWTLAKLSDITRKVGSGSTPRGGSDAYHSTGTPLIRSQNVRFEGFTDEGLVFLDDAQVDALRDARVQASDVLLNITGASIGRVCQVPHRLEGACVNQHVCIVRPITQALSPEFLSAFLASPAMQEMIWTEQYGVTRQALTKGQILDFDVPLPPLAEQRRIVAKVEELLGKVSACRQRLAKIPTILKRFRQSVLAAACSGRLTADWREDQSAEPSEASPEPMNGGDNDPSGEPNSDEVSGPVPNTWTWWSIEDACDDVIDYRGRTPPSESSGPIPHVRTTQIRDGRINWNTDRYISESTYREFMTRGIPRREDVLFTMEAPLGDVGVVDQDERFSVAQRILLLRAMPSLMTGSYFGLALQSAPIHRAILSRATGTTVQGIAFKRLRFVRVPVPPIEEQSEIVARVKQLQELADQLEARYRNADAHVEKLTQAILAKAFRGELVPTEHELAAREGRDYESAEQLLARLRAERSTADPAKPTRRPRKAKPAAKDD